MAVDAKVSEYLLELLRCSVHDTVPREKPAEVSWESVYTLARRHSVSALAFYALRERHNELPAAIAEAWEEWNAKLLAKGANQEHELARLCEIFEREQIPYMPLKGSCIRHLYPETHLREMSDLDILVQAENLTAACALAQTLGYSVDSQNTYHIDLQKKPYMCLELHMNLISPGSPYFRYYKHPWSFARASDTSCCHVMANEDYYVYMLAHTAKHYYYWTGTGIRSVLDVYLFNRAYRAALDLDYVARQLKKLKLVDFAKQIETLSERWFSSEPHSAETGCDITEMQYYILSSITYGSLMTYDQNIVRSYIDKGKSLRGAKLAMYMHMAFLPLCEMKVMYPILEKAPVLLPFCWVARWFRILIKKPGSVTAQYRRVASIDLYDKKTEQEDAG